MWPWLTQFGRLLAGRLKERLEGSADAKSLRSLDGVIVGVTVVLTFSGLIAVFSASGMLGTEPTAYLQRQALWLVLGFVCLGIVSRCDYHMWRTYVPYLVAGCVGLLAVALAAGSLSHGARRWIDLGILSIQPGELAKVVVVLYLASYLGKSECRIQEWRDGLLPPMVVISVFCGLLITQDFGTPVVMGLLLVGMVFLAGARMSHLLPLGGAAVSVAYWFVTQSAERMERITSFLEPDRDPLNAAYQLNQSFLALQNGGLFGQGLAQGAQKLGYLPEVHTDFVLALIGEELGLVGTTCFLGLFVILILKGFRVAAQAPDLFGRYLALGVTLLLGVQVLMNAGVVCGLLPTKGLTLPLVSYGGSSLVTSLIAIGLLLSVARRRVSPV